MDLQISGAAVAFGYFESLHSGHMAVLEALVAKAKAYNLCPTLILFESSGADEVYTAAEKEYIINEYFGGAIRLEKLSLLCPNSQPYDLDAFVKKLLVNELNAKLIVAGANFTFVNADGKARKAPELKQIAKAAGCNVSICDSKSFEGAQISDLLVKQALMAGSMEKASLLLGRAYSIMGKIVHGKAIGRTVKMPTANLMPPENKFLPAFGVYATESCFNGKKVVGLTNIGRRPSVDSQNKITIESFLIDFNESIYDETVYLELYHYIRGIMKLSGIEAVKKQVSKDILTAKRLMNIE